MTNYNVVVKILIPLLLLARHFERLEFIRISDQLGKLYSFKGLIDDKFWNFEQVVTKWL